MPYSLEDPFNEEPKPRLIFPFIAWFCIIVAAIAAAVLLPGCASKALPDCERYEYYQAIHPQLGPVAVLDVENATKLGALIKGISEGTCRLAKDGAGT